MDVMELRRGLLMGMAQGAYFEKGTITVPDSGSFYEINLNKQLDKYLIYIEATDETKAQIINNTDNNSKPFVFVGIYPRPSINSKVFGYLVGRYNPSAEACNGSAFTNGYITNSRFQVPINSLSGANVNCLYYGMTYNYFAVEIK